MRIRLIVTAISIALLVAGGFNTASSAAEKGGTSIEKVKGGYTVEELNTQKSTLNGKKVSVRGKVVKFNGGILGKNWLHLQDGTGKEGTNDFTVTTNQNAAVGDIVVATGVIAVNKDFGAGYAYAVIMEQATIKVEKK